MALKFGLYDSISAPVFLELVSTVWQHNKKILSLHSPCLFSSNFSSFLLSFDFFPSPLVHRLFSNLLCQRSPYTPTFFSYSISSVFLFHHPTSTLSVSLSLFILTSLCKGTGGEINYHCITPGYIWRHDATDVSGNILVPFFSALFLYVECDCSCCFFHQRCVSEIWCHCLSSLGMWHLLQTLLVSCGSVPCSAEKIRLRWNFAKPLLLPRNAFGAFLSIWHFSLSNIHATAGFSFLLMSCHEMRKGDFDRSLSQPTYTSDWVIAEHYFHQAKQIASVLPSTHPFNQSN